MLGINDITIDSEFEGLIPVLSDDERTQLMVNIQRDGFRDPLVVWLGHGILLDGHNRYRIWEASFQDDADREPSIVEMKFATREDAKLWIAKNQLGRRNLPDAQRVVLALQLKPSLEAKAKENKRQSGESHGRGKVHQKSDESIEPINVNKELATAAGVSHDTVHKVEKVLASGNADANSLMMSGPRKINAAFKAVSDPIAKETKVIKSQGVGVRRAHEAIACLKKIPTKDALRSRGMEIVRIWIEENGGL